MKSFSSRLIALRKERNMTQADLAKAISKTRSTVSGYETEGKEPDYEMLCFLANYFDVTTDYLLGISNVRTHNDAVFVNDTRQFSATYEGLPHDLKQSVASAFDSFYLLLSRDMKLRREERLSLYAEFFGLLQRRRAEIRNKIEQGSAADPAYLSDLMAMQSEFKNNVSVLLDQLMQADMGVASGADKKGASLASSKQSVG